MLFCEAVCVCVCCEFHTTVYFNAVNIDKKFFKGTLNSENDPNDPHPCIIPFPV